MENKFKIGEEVIALTHPVNEQCQPRVKGKIYIVKDIHYCSKCGQQSINIGPMSKSPLIDCDCGVKNQLCGYLHFTFSKYFIRPQELQSQLEQAVEEENYEFAATLRDINK